MKKLLGISVFLLLLYGALLLSDPGARSAQNHFFLGQRIGLFGIISLAAGLLIITGGIDLSMGSTVGLTSTILAILLTERGWEPGWAILAVLGVGATIGLVNGLLVTQLRVQAFVVTLCGLFIYRGAARWVAGDQQRGLGTAFPGLKNFLNGDLFGLPTYLVIFGALALAASVFLHLSVHGRYFFAIGSNERAAHYSGIATDFYKVLAYVLCSGLTALFGVLYLFRSNSVQPSSTGNFFELYAIAGAVLGGCSLRGGEGNVLGILIGTSILWMLPNLINMSGIPSALEDAVIGLALLLGAILDEFLRGKKDLLSGLAILNFILGSAGLLVTLFSVIKSPVDSDLVSLLVALVNTGLGFAALFAGVGLLKRRPWGRYLTLALAGILGGIGAWMAVNGAFLLLQDPDQVPGRDVFFHLTLAIVRVGYAALAFAVLLHPRARKEFR